VVNTDPKANSNPLRAMSVPLISQEPGAHSSFDTTGFDLSALRANLIPQRFVTEADEPWDHSNLFQQILFEINSQL
jgi:Intraflagellar transport protein 43